MTLDPRRPFSPSSLAERWQCSEQHVRNLISSGRLSGFRFGKMYRVSADEVDRYEGMPPRQMLESEAERIEPQAAVMRLAPERPAPVEFATRQSKSPDWPQAMKRKTAAAYCDLTETAFAQEVSSRRLPQPAILGGQEHWHRQAIDEALCHLFSDP